MALRPYRPYRALRSWLAAAASVCCVIAAFSQWPHTALADETSPETCSLTPGPTRTVTRILDGETLALDDGKEVRLIGALSPRARDAGATPGTWPLEEAAKTSLAELVLGKRIGLAFGASREDRYGRLLAHVFLSEGGRRIWVQGEMLQLGLARAYSLPGDQSCLTELIANEDIARTAGAGVWMSHLYAVRPAFKALFLMGQRSTFQIVRGRVVSVTRTKNAAYIDFGADWHTDFTISISKRVLTAHPDFSAQLESMKDKVVEVRGWIERRNGPLIALTSPAILKILDGDTGDEALEPPPVAEGTGKNGAGFSAPVSGSPPREQNRPEPEAPGDTNL